MHRSTIFAAAVLGLCGAPVVAAPTAPAPVAPAKQRLIVLTDIEADPDDTQSLIRRMLYANVIDIRGLIARTSTFPTDGVEPDSTRRVIAADGAVQPNLARRFAQNLRRMPVTALTGANPEPLHLILKVTDKGTPRLTRYQRVIVAVLPGRSS